MTASTSVLACAPTPFNQASADITLRTSDHVDFHVHSHILSQASPIFSDMLALPQPRNSQDKEKPPSRSVVDMTENSKTLERLLRLCYPIKKEDLHALEDITPVLQAALKYDMEWPVVLLTRDLVALIPQHPLRVWAIASRSGLEELAHTAASEILRCANATQSQPPPPLPFFSLVGASPHRPPAQPLGHPALDLLHTMLNTEGLEVLSGITAGNYYRLRQYLRSDIRLNRQAVLKPFASLSSGVTPSQSGHTATLPVDPSLPSHDLILECKDNKHLWAHQVVVSIHSSTLRADLVAAKAKSKDSDPASTGGTTDTSPSSTRPLVLPIDLDSMTLISLLGVCYDGESVVPSDLSQLAAMLVVAEKYGMSQIIPPIKRRWLERAAEDSLEAYLVAVDHGLTAYASTAARAVIATPLAGRYVPYMEDTAALAYHRLVIYYNACAFAVRERLQKAATDLGGAIDESRSKCPHGHSPWERNHVPSSSWIQTYLTGLAARTDSDGPGRMWEISMGSLLGQACASSQSTSYQVWPACTEPGMVDAFMRVFLEQGSPLSQAIETTLEQLQVEL